MSRRRLPTSPGELLVSFDGGAERVLDLPQGVGVSTAQQALAANPAVAYAVPNYIAHASGHPQRSRAVRHAGGLAADPVELPAVRLALRRDRLPSYQAKGGLNAPEAWDILKQRGAAFGRGARVAVLDTGIAYMNKKPAVPPQPRLLP